MEHQFVSWTKREVHVARHPADGEVPRIIYTSKPEERIGCIVCNMGLEEALTIDCPGRDLFKELEGELRN